MTETPTDKKLSERFGGFDSAEQQERAVFMDAFDAADSKLFAKGVAAGIAALDKLRALRLAESHPSAIREAVEGEREACAKLVAAYGIAGMPFDVGSWTPGAVAAAIRARGEEKGK